MTCLKISKQSPEKLGWCFCICKRGRRFNYMHFIFKTLTSYDVIQYSAPSCVCVYVRKWVRVTEQVILTYSFDGMVRLFGNVAPYMWLWCVCHLFKNYLITLYFAFFSICIDFGRYFHLSLLLLKFQPNQIKSILISLTQLFFLRWPITDTRISFIALN